MSNYKNLIKSIMVGIGAITAHHFGSQILDYRETIQNTEIEETRHTNMMEKLETLEQKADIIIQNQESQDKALTILKKCEESVSNVRASLDVGNIDSATIHSNVVQNCIDKVFDIYNNSSNNFNMNFNLKAYYDYLDSLSLLQESSLLHILIYIIILITLINLMTTLFANELIKYFELENKHRYIKQILMLRSKFQRYYFILNFSILYIIIITMLILDLIVFLH